MAADWEIVVVGAGAAGLIAAARAAELGRSVLLLEKNRKPGVKILMSGGTRCNLTHATDNRGIVEAYGPPGRFLHSALAALGVDDSLQLFHDEGLRTKVEPNGKIFPESDRALDVLHALLRRLERSGAVLALAEPVLALQTAPEGFSLQTPRRTLTAARVILNTGGRSYPGCGTTGDGYAFAAQFGHAIVPPRPALVPITSRAPWVAALSGITLPDIQLQVLDGDRRLDTRRGSLLFAHFGLTGPVALDASRAISGHDDPGRLQLALDLLPDRSAEDLDRIVQAEALASGKKRLATVLAGLLPTRVVETVLARAGQPIERKAAGLTRGDRAALVGTFKKLLVPVAGTLGFEKAEVTAGGVALDEVDSRTLQSRKQPGLYFAGELLDLDGPIGGYNFQAAWSTGWLAGTRAAESL